MRDPSSESCRSRTPSAVLFDRDDTLITDVAYLNDPGGVQPVAGAEQALDLLRSSGIEVGVVTNQSGVARGFITPDQLEAVNARVEQLLGPFGTWQVCVHGPDDGCTCRKPAPGLVLSAARELGVEASRCVVIGDTRSDIEAAHAAGARGILVGARPPEVPGARGQVPVARDLTHAVRLALASTPGGSR
ncbi:haloacid dehalogenase superfamily, subfamily IA, variant 3 with third motif having DD or ED/haloacid dehalogenase superfamily, subfamily IA, variant 1 with third motif having Dx(3-4)D or Dx(3-4)E [Amycolatopsis xylanica]|uniref:D,D-heptose 1,7-bisphosphate phosphatase n=1 Tax=Amycolatopsis xylanica TaxID=589385 RepID=A0A1H2TFV2_9PSEU|nr:haloacid dehalogenase superfamily, subfamily IA, variant 3 with third motif having DD or ED/haloacid dehalogenase superfamily, subfamily IA, variant 1 with third motif having Dx(3-4)D or Dx(3-4)E [Amycolatopsis xylanica]